MGAVFRARDRSLGRDVAIKLLWGAVDGSARARFLREAKVLARLRHPHIPEIYEAGEVPEAPYLVLELLECEDLAEPRESLDRVRVAREVTSALRAVHRAGVLHRDIKPANLLEAEDGRILLGDFGLVQVEGEDALTRTGALVGTPFYLAPELFAGAPQGPASDWWALGMTLGYLIEGRLPYRYEQLPGLGFGVETAPPTWTKLEGGHPLRRVVERMLSIDPGPRQDPGGWILETLEDCPAWDLGKRSAPLPRLDPATALVQEDREDSPPAPPPGPNFFLQVFGALSLVGAAFAWGWLRSKPVARPPPLPAASTRSWYEDFRAEWNQDPLLRTSRISWSPDRGWFASDPEAPTRTLGLTGGDPLWWGVLAERSKTLRSWVEEAEPWPADPKISKALEKIDRRVLSRSGIPFFQGLADLSARSTPVSISREELLAYDGRNFNVSLESSGWAGTAIQEFRGFFQARETLFWLLKDEPKTRQFRREDLGPLPEALPLGLPLRYLEAESILNDWISHSKSRRDLESWAKPQSLHFRHFWAACLASLRREPQRSEVVLDLAERMAREGKSSFPLPFLMAPDWAVFRSKLKGEGEEILGWLLRHTAETRRLFLGIDRGAYLESLLRPDPKELDWSLLGVSKELEARLKRRIFLARLEVFELEKDWKGLRSEVDFFAGHPESMVDLGGPVEVGLRLFEFPEEAPPILSPEARVAWVELLRAAEKTRGQERRFARLEARHAELGKDP